MCDKGTINGEDDTTVVQYDQWVESRADSFFNGKVYKFILKFEKGSVNADALSGIIKEECALPDPVLTTLLATVSGEQWTRIVSSAEVFVRLLAADGKYKHVNTVSKLGSICLPGSPLHSHNPPFFKVLS